MDVLLVLHQEAVVVALNLTSTSTPPLILVFNAKVDAILVIQAQAVPNAHLATILLEMPANPKPPLASLDASPANHQPLALTASMPSPMSTESVSTLLITAQSDAEAAESIMSVLAVIVATPSPVDTVSTTEETVLPVAQLATVHLVAPPAKPGSPSWLVSVSQAPSSVLVAAQSVLAPTSVPSAELVASSLEELACLPPLAAQSAVQDATL